MIFLDPHLNMTSEEIEAVNSDYMRFVGEEHLATCSARGWDYAAIVKNGNFCETDTALDIGCAASYLALYLAQFVGKSHGIDDIQNGGFERFGQPWLETMQDFEAYREGRFIFHNQNAASLPFENEYFDKIVTVSAMEHFGGSDDTLCVKEIYRILKPGGLFLGTVDYNGATEIPQAHHPLARAYTYESFVRRILNPSGLSLVGKDYVVELPVPSSVNYLAAAMFFCLHKA